MSLSQLPEVYQLQHQPLPVLCDNDTSHIKHILISYSKEFQTYPVLPMVLL